MSDIKTRIFAFDFLKVISCFAVVALHCTNIYGESALHFFFSFAVPIFFMVNGALIVSRIVEGKCNAKYFLIKSIKLFFIIFAWNLLYSFYELIIKNQFNFFDSLINGIRNNGNFPQFWFLWSLIFIYIVLIFIFKYINNYSKIRNLTIILFVFSSIINILNSISMFFNVKLITDFLSYIPVSLRLIDWLFYFCLGYILFLRTQNNDSKISCSKIINLVLFCLLFILFMLFGIKFGFADRGLAKFYCNPFCILYVSCFFVLIVSIYKTNNSCKIGWIVEFLSPLIIGVYAIHFKVIYYMYKVYTPSIITVMLITLVVFLISVLISYIIYKIPYVNKLIKI